MKKRISLVHQLMYFASGILIGASMFLLTNAAYTVETNIDNAVQVIKTIILQTSGGSTGSVLDGDTINTVHMEATQYCDETSNNCVDIADVYSSESAVDAAVANNGYLTGESDPVFSAQISGYYTKTEINQITGVLMNYIDANDDDSFVTYSGDYYTKGESDSKYLTAYVETDPIYISHSGDYYTKGESDAKYSTNNTWLLSGTSVIYTSGSIGIGTENPATDLDVNGSIRVQDGNIYGGASETDTYVQIVNEADPEYIRFMIEGTEYLNLLDLDGGALNQVIINDTSADIDFRVESDNNQNAIFVDGTNGNVGIGKNNPGTALEVNGVIRTIPAATAPTCDGSMLGSIYYDDVQGHFYGCRGDGRRLLDN